MNSGGNRTDLECIMRSQTEGSWAIRFFLRLLAVCYGAVTAFRNLLYNHNILKQQFVPTRVVSIGNITVGGTGKTPATIMTARLLRDAGLKAAVVSRGYGGTAKGPLAVSDGRSELADAVTSGDEPLVIARALPDVPVVVGADRVKAAEFAIDRFLPRVIVLDDAFQHRRLARTADVVTLDGNQPLGNEYLLPRGILRESPFGLKRALAVIVTRWDDNRDRGPMERLIRYYNRNINIFFSRHVPDGLREPGGDKADPPETLNGMKIAALSNIARPESFVHMLESLGANIVHHHAAPDHHRHTAAELDTVMQDARAAGADMLVMTAKDERNLPPGWRVEGIPARVLDIRMELIENEDAYLGLISP